MYSPCKLCFQISFSIISHSISNTIPICQLTVIRMKFFRRGRFSLLKNNVSVDILWINDIVELVYKLMIMLEKE